MAAGFVLTIPNKACAATENELRKVMGIGSIDKTSLQEKTDALTDRLAREENYNDLVSILKDNSIKMTFTSDEIKKEKKSYAVMIKSFSKCDSASSVIEKFSDYDSYTYFADQTSYGSMDVSYINTSGTKDKLKSLSTLKKIMTNKKDIGTVGSSMQKITKNMDQIKTAKKDVLALKTKKGEKIASAFNGITEAGTDAETVVIRSGQTIVVTYSGVKNSLKPGTKVNQGEVIGKASKNSIRVYMKMNGSNENILLVYGPEGTQLYEAYISENPWEDQELDFSQVTEYKKPKKKKKQTKKITVIKDGKESEVPVYSPGESEHGQVDDRLLIPESATESTETGSEK